MDRKTKHTPGPWRVRWGTNVFAGERCVATCATTMGGPDHDAQAEASEATAQLIAATPDLLEALCEAVQGDGRDDEGVAAVWLEKAEAALTKAGVSVDD